MAADQRVLEVIDNGWHSASCWRTKFVEFFANPRDRAVAMSLRGHGGSPAGKPLHACSIADDVHDVASRPTASADAQYSSPIR